VRIACADTRAPTAHASAAGTISTEEILQHGAALEHARLRNRTYKTLFVILALVWLAQMAAIFGIVAGVVLYTRQTVVPSGGAALTTRDGTAVIQTAAYTQESAMSSALPDDAFSQLTHFTVTAPGGSWVKLAVLGVARITGTGTFGSVMTLLTVAGSITIDGRDMSFATDVAPVFQQAGFMVAPSGRRLLDVGTALRGFFSYLATFDLDALEAAALGLTAPNTTFPGIPDSYIMEATAYTVCDVPDDATGLWCYSADAAPMLATNADFPDTPFFAEESSVTVLGSQTRSVSSFSFTSRTHLAVTDSSSNAMLEGDFVGGAWSNCVAGDPGSTAAPTSVFDAIVALRLPPVFVDSNSTVLGVTARHFTFTAPSAAAGAPPALVLHYYDSVTAHKPLRLMLTKPALPLASAFIVDFSRFEALSASDVALSTFTWSGPALIGGAFPACGNTTVVEDGAAAYVAAELAAEAAAAPAPVPAAGRRSLLQSSCPGSTYSSANCVYSTVRDSTTCAESSTNYKSFCCPPSNSYSVKFYNLASNNASICSPVTSACTGTCCAAPTGGTNGVPLVPATLANGGCILCGSTSVAGNTACSYTPPSGRRSLLQTAATAVPVKTGATSLRFLSDGTVQVDAAVMTINYGYATWPADAQAYCAALFTSTACKAVVLSASVKATYRDATKPLLAPTKALAQALKGAAPGNKYTWLGYDTSPDGTLTCTAIVGTTLSACYRAYELSAFQTPVFAARTVVTLRSCITTQALYNTVTFGTTKIKILLRPASTSCETIMSVVVEDLLVVNGEEQSARRGVLVPNACVTPSAAGLPNYRAIMPSLSECADVYGGLGSADGAVAAFGANLVFNNTKACFGCNGLATCPLATLPATSAVTNGASPIYTCPSGTVKRYSFDGWRYAGCAAEPEGTPTASFWGVKLTTTTINGVVRGPAYTVAQCQSAADLDDALTTTGSVAFVGVSATGECYVSYTTQYSGAALLATTCVNTGAFAGWPPQLTGGAAAGGIASLAVYQVA
jgi:hypothetical protein